jgi:Tfp pilus assembly protein PilZ
MSVPGATFRKEYQMLNALRQTDRRLCNRTSCDLHADVEDHDNSYSGKIRNLGKGGAFIEATIQNAPAVGREVIMTIPFKGRPNYLIIKARIAWAAEDGIGVTFMKVQ